MAETKRFERTADAAGGSAAHSDAQGSTLRLFGFRFFFRDKGAATAIEYALVAGSIAVVIIAAVNSLGQTVNTMFFQQVVQAMQ